MTTNFLAYTAALKLFPGGVNSPVRAFKAVGLDPIFISKAKGSKIYDVEGKCYIDYVGSWGPMILGHADDDVVNYMSEIAKNGLSFGAPTIQETELAEEINYAFPHMEKMRFVNSGTEATMSAIRLARGVTNRDLVLKFDGCYHGHSDSLLVSAGSGVATFAIPGSLGVPNSIAQNTIVVPFNDIEAVEKAFRAHGSNIAAVIVEPVCGNMGVVKPLKGFLAELRRITRNYDSLLIFDEVMTGFRACYGGVSNLEQITPDITCLGKVVGGGMPLAVYGGKNKLMSHIAPEGRVYQAGTLSGNPVAVACGLATIRKIRGITDFYDQINSKTEKLCKAIISLAKEYNIPVQVNYFGSMFTVFFNKEVAVYDYETAKRSDTKMFAKFFKLMLDQGVYLPPSQFEAAFISYAHTDEDIAYTIGAVKKAFENLH